MILHGKEFYQAASDSATGSCLACDRRVQDKPDMGTPLAKSIRAARERRGISQQAVADHIGVSRQSVTHWETGKNLPSTEHLMEVCAFLGTSVEALKAGIPAVPPAPGIGRIGDFKMVNDQRQEARDFEQEMIRAHTDPASARQAPQDVPVYGIAVGGNDGSFFLNGEIVDYVRRPAGASRAKAVYAIFVVGSSMSPRYEEGELVYVNPGRPPAIGDYVVVQLADRDDGSPGVALIKRLTKRTGVSLTLSQFNPAKDIQIPLSDVKAMHHVMTTNELLGI